MSSTGRKWFKSTYSSSGDGDCVEVALDWHKSTYSSGSDGDCVEVALTWHKSTYSSGSEGDCVEIATCPTAVHVRDSKDREGPRLSLTAAAWETFLPYVAGTASRRPTVSP
ncbi:hypothetical protein GCM10018793_36620 [Streptomyces sulfonofaciens]|uniref:DUF397 domain-containing protein n=1 Tax=Streptomyces sulfonofaciens TaxID=68272 RepID=A0A919L295_9ACTN|nr:DUF397 domain-containing protein [Streptomyces sulfonofaciens]GHH80754.1 hypothetical protein GCM10018793_36620 [Streptomyces sulfonofaciens]